MKIETVHDLAVYARARVNALAERGLLAQAGPEPMALEAATAAWARVWLDAERLLDDRAETGP